jgi:hypothetical protein
MRDELNASLPAPFFAVSGTRVYLESPDRYVGPAAQVRRVESGSRPNRSFPDATLDEVATLTRARPVQIVADVDERRETYLEVYVRRRPRERLVSSLEVLSPSNKTPGSTGRKLYRLKQRQLLAREVNRIEIDLLRGGKHVTAAPLVAIREQKPGFAYHVAVRPYVSLDGMLVYAAALTESLPDFPVPLLSGVRPVVLDLQAIFTHVYDHGPYARWIDYRRPIVPPLTKAQMAWAKKLLAKKTGKR